MASVEIMQAEPQGNIAPTTVSHMGNAVVSASHEALTQIDWDFDRRADILDLESIHPYPAKFIGDIPRSLLLSLPLHKNTAVFDPFCGSGTTLTEAQRAGFPSIGIDLNPIACLISRVKTLPGPNDIETVAELVCQRATKLDDLSLPTIPNLDHWFKLDIQRAIASIIHCIANYAPPNYSDILRLALSSIIVRVSNQDSDTRYAAVDKNVSWKDVFSGFLSAARKIQKSLLARNWPLVPSFVIEGNTLNIPPKSIPLPVGMVITSPPYPNAYEYWLYHKYRMWWLGLDPLAVKAQEIGARAHFFKRNHHTAEDFILQMRSAFGLIDSVLVAGGCACFVVGRSKIHGKIVDNAEIISSVAEELKYSLLAKIDRTISPNRKSFNLSHANIKKETIVVLRKP